CLIPATRATVGASNVSVIATDGAGASRTVSFPWTIEFPVSGALSPASVQIQPGQTAKTTLALSSTGNAESVTWSPAAPAGVSISPSSGTLSVPADGSANVSLTVTGGTGGSYTIPVPFTSSGAVPPVQLGVIVDKPGDLSPFYNVTGIASDGTTNTANFDGNGFSYSEQALAAAGSTPGGPFLS